MSPRPATLARALLLALIASGVVRAQEHRPPDAPAAEPKQPAPDREFKPSQEVSPDQEVDFPADI